MRRGELLGLKWPDIDFEKGKIHIQRNLVRITGEGLILKGLKTPHTCRQISISPYVADVLKKHKEAQDVLKKHLDGDYIDHGLVFCAENGSFRDPRNVLREFRERIKSKGFPTARSTASGICTPPSCYGTRSIRKSCRNGWAITISR